MMRLLKIAAIATAVGAREFHMGKPEEGIDECSDTKDEEACKQAFLTQDGQPFRPLSDPQFSITYPSDNFNMYTMMQTEQQFVTCLSLAELAFITDSFNIQTTNNNKRAPVNYMIKHPLNDNPTYIMTARVRFFGNGSLVENAINENLAGKPCNKKLPEPKGLREFNDVIYYVLTVGAGIVVSGSLLVILCSIVMDECSKKSKKSNSEQEMTEVTPLMQGISSRP